MQTSLINIALSIALFLVPTLAGATEETIIITSQMNTNTRPWLDEKDWQWLKDYELTVGIVSPDHPPISIIEDNRYQGISADYLSLLLPRPPKVKKYPSRKLALDALQNGEIDILERGNIVEAQERNLFFSDFYMRQQSVLVQSMAQPFSSDKPENILALAIEGATEKEAKIHYPHSLVKEYHSPLIALEELALGDVDGVLLELSSAQYLIQTKYMLDLQIENFSNLNSTGLRFLFARHQKRLERIINRGLPLVQRKHGEAIRRNWSAGHTLHFQDPKIGLTTDEREWINRNPYVSVAVIPSLGPLSQLDSKNTTSGIAHDYLDLISQRSRLKFTYVQTQNISEAEELLRDGKALMTPYFPPQVTSTADLEVLPPYLHTSPVLMTLQKENRRPRRLKGLESLEGKKLAMTEGYFLENYVKNEYPNIKITSYQNTVEAMQSVEQGSNDAILTNNFIGPYLSMQYFSNRIKIAEILSNQPIPLGIAVAKDQEVLKNILRKSQLTITPEEVSRILYRWRPNFSEGKKDFWKDHKEAIIKTTSIFLMLILVCLTWAFYLVQQVKKTRSAEKRAEAASQAKTHFITTLNHEIRNPLNAIIGLQEIALERSKNEKKTTHILETANEAAQNLLLLLTNVLDLSRIESGKLEPTLQTINLKEFLQKSTNIVRNLAQQKRLNFTTYISESTDLLVLIDKTSLNQIIANLLSNSIKFTEIGEVSIEAHTYIHNEKTFLRLTIADTGVGINEEDQKKLFQPFSQVGEKTQAHLSGSGLGLSITQKLLGLMGGQLSLSSKEGVGTSFTVRLPLSLVTVPPSLQSIKTPKENTEPLSVLIAEDHPFNRLALQMQLEKLGHSVQTANNGNDAWKHWRPGKFNIIITDNEMPTSSGSDLIEKVRKEEQRSASTPSYIIVLTASAEKDMTNFFLSRGADAVLYKPATTAQLESAILNYKLDPK
ncbi:TPA: ATP-binding protein [Pseudomonas aeruginosa]